MRYPEQSLHSKMVRASKFKKTNWRRELIPNARGQLSDIYQIRDSVAVVLVLKLAIAKTSTRV